MGERRETLEMDRAMRAQWARAIDVFSRPVPLVDRCEAWVGRAAAMPVKLETIRPVIATATRDREQPPDIYTEMQAVTPQAILRDLHRPSTSFGISDYDRIETGWDRGARGATAEMRGHIAHSYRIDVGSLLATQRSIDADRREMRTMQAIDWASVAKPDDAERPGVPKPAEPRTEPGDGDATSA